MTQFVYMGPGSALSLAGRNLPRGIPVELEGRAADAAAHHPDVHAHSASAEHSAASAGLDAYRALKARAKEIGLPATGKAEEVEAAIAAEETRLGSEAE